MTREQTQILSKHKIEIVEKVITSVEHQGGYLRDVVFEDGTRLGRDAMYIRPEFEQNSVISEQLGCELTERSRAISRWDRRRTQPYPACSRAEMLSQACAPSQTQSRPAQQPG